MAGPQYYVVIGSVANAWGRMRSNRGRVTRSKALQVAIRPLMMLKWLAKVFNGSKVADVSLKINMLDRRICVAPMMDWTDRHCRFLHRLYAPHALLYTEMIVAGRIVRGDVRQLLDHDRGEHPVALQLGGCDPAELGKAARIGTSAGYAEINLNVGCPSDRVQNGSFGACLMLKPQLVADCVRSMRAATSLPVT